MAPTTAPPLREAADHGPDPGAAVGDTSFEAAASALSDQAVLEAIVAAQRTENRARAQRLALLSEFHHRCERSRRHRAADSPFFLLTALQETKAEVAPLLGVGEMSVEVGLDLCRRLRTWFPAVWQRCRAGRLDLGRAQLFLDAADTLADEADIPRLAELMEDYLSRHDDPEAPVMQLTRTQLRRALAYRKLRFRQKSSQESFAQRFAKRRVSLRVDDTGIAHLGMTHTVTDATAADYRLTLIAKQVRRDGDNRTLEQVRADVMMDLLLGRLEVAATTSDLEETEGESERFRRHRVGAFARPVVNVTVPVQTLLGISDRPGVMSGGVVIPAALARTIAVDPESTWYRMLTDASGAFLDLSTESYTPSDPLWRCIVAEHPTCLHPGCSRPAVVCELDHRVPFPGGGTCRENLGPLCKRHHKVKHAAGFDMRRNSDGSYSWTTRTGSRFRVHVPEQPTAPWPGIHELERIEALERITQSEGHFATAISA